MADPAVQPIGARPTGQVAAGWLVALFAALFALQIALYSESFDVGPAGDDLNAPLADIWRGERDGPWALLERSAQPHNYRPLQSLAMWAFGTVAPQHRLLCIHLLHFAGMLVFAGAAWLWFRALPTSRVAALCGAATIFLHPALVAPLAGIDGFATLFSAGLMWLSVYIVWAGRDRLGIGVPLALLLFVLAIGFKEYALGAVPLVCFAMLCFSHTPRQALGRAVAVGAAFSMVVLAFVLLRRFTIPPPAPGQEVGYLVIDPLRWIKNAALFAGVLLFPGSTPWLFLNRTALVLAIGALSILMCGGTLVAGLWRRWQDDDDASPSREPDESRRWIAFAALGVFGASFPAILVGHVSEMYVAGMVLPLGLLVALATDGIRRCSAAWRFASLAVFLGALLWAMASVLAKVSDMRRMGDLTDSMLRQVLALLPPDARDLTVAVCFEPEAPTARAYSVFQMPAHLLVEQPQALWWLRPHRGLQIEFPQPTLEEALANAQKYALIVRWNPAAQRMELVRSNLPAGR